MWLPVNNGQLVTGHIICNILSIIRHVNVDTGEVNFTVLLVKKLDYCLSIYTDGEGIDAMHRKNGVEIALRCDRIGADPVGKSVLASRQPLMENDAFAA